MKGFLGFIGTDYGNDRSWKAAPVHACGGNEIFETQSSAATRQVKLQLIFIWSNELENTMRKGGYVHKKINLHTPMTKSIQSNARNRWSFCRCFTDLEPMFKVSKTDRLRKWSCARGNFTAIVSLRSTEALRFSQATICHFLCVFHLPRNGADANVNQSCDFVRASRPNSHRIFMQSPPLRLQLGAQERNL